ncbi:protein HIGH ARSENIC CONTENT 1, mitochondrial-like [Citrus sinensis]|uniref:protein HIGH ARSENIC CONTENT 1, mitochondrial-like n=1 Tax=Citrus sinensis TaxID=2711 RepID=UPI000D6265C9|nr:protein HIGH ARSENIC CONTENT 1, mitochondrial-like [Citrus sinensis]
MMSCRNIFALTKLRKNSFIPIRTIIDVGKRPAGDVASVGVDTAKDLLSSGHRFLDVRTTEEFNESHVHGALNVPYLFITQEGDLEFIILPNFQNPEATNTVLDASYIVSPGNVSRKQFVFSDFLAIFPGRVKNPEFLTQVASVCSKEDHIIVGCKSGIRSLCACVDLLNAGYEHVTSMEGGYSAWLDKELAEDK